MLRNSPNLTIRFGETVERYNPLDQSVFPFIYTLVPAERDTWEQDKSPLTLGNLSDIGPTVAPGETIQHAVVLDPDYLFKILWIRYTVYSLASAPFPVGNNYLWYEPLLFVFPELADYQTYMGTAYIKDLRATVSLTGSDQRILYGGANLEQQVNLGAGRIPAVVDAIQGYDYGRGELATPYLVGKSTVIMFEFTHTGANNGLPMTVGAAIYGMKVRL